MDGFELMQRIAKAFSQADLVPKQYQGNLPNCMIALDMAQRMGANPLMVMQNLYIVHGHPGLVGVSSDRHGEHLRVALLSATSGKASQAVPTTAAGLGRLRSPPANASDGIWVTWKMVNDEGWAAKNGSKWKTMPDQMFIYRAAAFWQRAYAPDLGMGLQTAEELQDVIDAKRDADGSFTVDLDVCGASRRSPTRCRARASSSGTRTRRSDRHRQWRDHQVGSAPARRSAAGHRHRRAQSRVTGHAQPKPSEEKFDRVEEFNSLSARRS